jgi:hypothetical protein
MTTEKKYPPAVQAKLGLADKYARLAKSVKSRPRRESWLRASARFRRQAGDLIRAYEQHQAKKQAAK